MRTLNTIQKVELEALIDGASLAGVIYALVEIANEKGEHITAHWQDAGTAKCWHRAARRIDGIVDAVHNIGV